MKSYSDRLYTFFMRLLNDENTNHSYEHGSLTINEVHIISKIDPEEQVTVSELAARLNLSLSSTSIAVDNLIKKGFLVRKRSQKDRRKVLVSLEKPGKELYQSHSKYHEQRLEKISKGIPGSELAVFFSVIEKMEYNLESEALCDDIQFPLSAFKEGDVLTVCEVCGGNGKKSSLAELGIFKNADIRIVRKQRQGPLILEVKGSRLSIGRKMADSIFCTEREET